MKKVLILGAGFVASPLIRHLLAEGFELNVASQQVSQKVHACLHKHPHARIINVDANDDTQVATLIPDCDLVISLLPYTFHTRVAQVCINYKKNMVTASYVSQEMRALDKDAQAAGIIILNEIGLDPGIDHMSAMQTIHKIEDHGGKVISFQSYCGGLPAMQSNNKPFGYKFSWSPRGVVMAGRNNGQYLQDGKVIFIPSKDLFKHFEIIDVDGVGHFEAYTNRNALPYKEIYGLKDAHTIFRGTLRDIGWCYSMQKAQELGLFDDSPRADLKGLTYKGLIMRLIGVEKSLDIVKDTADFLKLEKHSTVIKRFQWLGLFEDDPLPAESDVMDVFCALLQKKLSMDKDDLDTVIMYHTFIAEYPDKKERITSKMVETGIPQGDSAMARTVGLPVAIGAAMILHGEINVTGVHIPTTPAIYEPILKELGKSGIKFIERVQLLE